VPLLISQGHKVVGLCRNEEGAEKLRKQGAEPLIGDLRAPEKLAAAAKEADGVIHLAYIHDFSIYAEAAQIEIEVVKAFGEVLKGTGKPLISTSGTAMLGRIEGRIPDDSDVVEDQSQRGPRAEAEKITRALAKDNIRACVLRLPPFVYGNNGKGFIVLLIEAAKQAKVSYYIGDGTNKAVFAHVDDVAQAYVLALTKGQAGAAYHITNQSYTHKELAEAIGKLLGLEVKSLTNKEEAARLFTFLYNFGLLENDLQVTNSRTKKDLGWQPKHTSVLDDVAHGSYKART